jgi:hypothetical protein
MKKFKRIVNLITEHGKPLAFFLAALCLLNVQEISAQRTPTPTPKPTPKTTNKPNTTATPKIYVPMPRPNPLPPKPSESKKIVVNEGDTPAEKSIATEPKVKLSLCVKSGSVRINGWDRNEVRGYVENGSQLGFKIAQKNPKTEKPVWIYVLGFDPRKTKELKPEECLSGENIEFDVPRNATIELRSEESEIRVESVGRVVVKTLSGDLYLNNIANGVEAVTYRGDISVEKSSGQMILENNGDGNILAVEVAPSEIGDIFKAKTDSGRIILQGVEHRQIGATSISGSIGFDGELLSGGQYTFSATNGSIVLGVPPDSQCKINAWFGFGAFSSDLPLQNALKKERSLSAELGSAAEGTCALNLKTGSGVIRIRKRNTATKEKSRNTVEKNTKTVGVRLTNSVRPTTKTKTGLTIRTKFSATTPKVSGKQAGKRR